jgi:hypothetical protein
MAFLGANPAFLRQDDGDGLALDEGIAVISRTGAAALSGFPFPPAGAGCAGAC